MRTLTELRRPPTPEAKPRRRWRCLAALLLLLLIGGMVWAVRPDPHLARVQELQKELANAKDLSPDDRKAKFQELRDQMKHLSDDQKWELASPFLEKQKAEMDRYFALAPKEKVKYLDEKIDQSEKMRKEWEKKGVQSKSGGGGMPATAPVGLGGGGPKQRSNEEIEKRRKDMLNRTTPEERAHTDQFREEMNDRRRRRGLPVR